MNKKSKIALLGLGVAVGIGLGTSGIASAATSGTDLSPMFQGLAGKFGLNQAKVTTYLEGQREEQRAEREIEFSESLKSALENGTITQTQYETILEKHEEIQSTREEMFQNHGKIKGRGDDLREYLEEQGVSPEDVLPEREGFGKRGGQGLRVHQNQ